VLEGAEFFGQGTIPPEMGVNITNFMVNVNTDYLVTYIIGRFGWVAFLGLLMVLAIFLGRGAYLCMKQKSILGKLVSLSVLMTLVIEMAVYILSNLGYQFFTQTSLPFVSFGGMAVCVNLGLLGVLLSVFRSGELVRDRQNGVINNRGRFIEIVDGKLIIDIGGRKTPV